MRLLVLIAIVTVSAVYADSARKECLAGIQAFRDVVGPLIGNDDARHAVVEQFRKVVQLKCQAAGTCDTQCVKDIDACLDKQYDSKTPIDNPEQCCDNCPDN